MTIYLHEPILIAIGFEINLILHFIPYGYTYTYRCVWARVKLLAQGKFLGQTVILIFQRDLCIGLVEYIEFLCTVGLLTVMGINYKACANYVSVSF